MGTEAADAEVEKIIGLIKQSAARRGVAPSTFCARVTNDGKFFGRLRRGGTLTLPVLLKLNGTLDTPYSLPAPREVADAPSS